MTDYISRESALDRIVGYDFQHCPDYMEDWATELKHAVICDLKDAVETLPAADVAPVVHGRWIRSPDCPEEYDICSVCGLNDKHRTRADGEHPAFESIPLFCKWCGAKMDGGEQDAVD